MKQKVNFQALSITLESYLNLKTKSQAKVEKQKKQFTPSNLICCLVSPFTILSCFPFSYNISNQSYYLPKIKKILNTIFTLYIYIFSYTFTKQSMKSLLKRVHTYIFVRVRRIFIIVFAGIYRSCLCWLSKIYVENFLRDVIISIN